MNEDSLPGQLSASVLPSMIDINRALLYHIRQTSDEYFPLHSNLFKQLNYYIYPRREGVYR